MPGRTTKKRAQRIDLGYFKRSYSIPRYRAILSVALTAAALLWLASAALRGKQSPYNAGPLSHPHAILTRDCAACHISNAAFSKKVSGQACLACHDGPIHQSQQLFAPACQDCHVEHQGAFTLSQPRDEACTRCHSDLKTRDGRTTVAAKVTSFASDHPEFAGIERGDPGTVRLNHLLHLRPIRGPRGSIQLTCAGCHQSNGALMAPVNYEKHCAACHSLEFDARIPEPAPHKKMEVVMDFVAQKFRAYIAAHPDEVHKADPTDPRIMRPPLPPAKDATEWVARRVAEAKILMARKTCAECHQVLFHDSTRDEIAAARIPARWFTKAEFDHESHQMLACTECHSKAPTSQGTSDVLIPGIETCRQCHRPGSESAEARCFECHAYHDWSKAKPVTGAFTISAVH